MVRPWIWKSSIADLSFFWYQPFLFKAAAISDVVMGLPFSCRSFSMSISLLRKSFTQHRSYQPSGRFIGELHHRHADNLILFFLSIHYCPVYTLPLDMTTMILCRLFRGRIRPPGQNGQNIVDTRGRPSYSSPSGKAGSCQKKSGKISRRGITRLFKECFNRPHLEASHEYDQ